MSKRFLENIYLFMIGKILIKIEYKFVNKKQLIF
jgi:hypothetical protein